MKRSVQRPPLSFEERMATKANKLFQLFIYTGIRRCELFNLFSAERIGDGWNILGKGSKYRLVPYSDEVAQLIAELKPIWANISTRTINNYFKKISEETGFAITPHRLRATFATQLIENGVDLVTIQTLMGHADVTQTARYVILSTKRLILAARTLFAKDLSTEGLTPFEMEQEIMRLRYVNMRLTDELNQRNGDDNDIKGTN